MSSAETVRRPVRFTMVYGMAIGLAVVAGVLRVWGLKWGLPDATHLFSYHPDEYHSLRGLLSLVTAGDLNPHFFNYGSLYLYLVSAAAMLAHGRLIFSLTAENLPDALRLWTLDARVVTVVAAIATIIVVFLLARRILGDFGGIVSALLLAAAPLHVLNSHYGTVDVTQALFVALALLFSVRLGKSGRWQDCAWAGAMAGLAASTKYSGIAVVIAPLAAVVLTARGRVKKLLTVLVGAVLAFALTSPFTFLDWSEAKQHIAFELEHMRHGEPLEVAAEPSGLLFHAKNLLAPGAGPVVILAVIGGALAFARKRRTLLPIAVFALLWTVMIATAKVRYARYEVPLLPVLVILGTVPVAALFDAGSWRRSLAYVLALICLVPSLYWSVQTCSGLARPDPRARALATILQTTPPDATVGLVRDPWFDVPALDYCNGGRILRQNPLWRIYQRPVRELVITDFDGLALTAKRPYSFVLSEFNSRAGLLAGDERVINFVGALLGSYQRQDRYGGLPLDYVPWELASDWLYPWPEIQIYVRKNVAPATGGE